MWKSHLLQTGQAPPVCQLSIDTAHDLRRIIVTRFALIVINASMASHMIYREERTIFIILGYDICVNTGPDFAKALPH